MNENQYWINRSVLITGGSSGLGRALAKVLVAKGAQVAVVARGQDKLEKLKEEEPEITIIQGDVSNMSDIYKISQQATGRLGQIDVLFNNASYLGSTPLRKLIDTECEDLAKILETNVLGLFRLTKSVLPHMMMQNKGLIINISSDAAVSAYPTWGGYSVSKAAVDHLTRIWQEELSNKGITFLSLDPGDMYTQMHLDAIPDANVEELYKPEDVAASMIDFLEREKYGQVRFAALEWRGLLP